MTSIIWNGVKCNIIDTPGHMDFIRSGAISKMLDGAVLILSGKAKLAYKRNKVVVQYFLQNRKS